MMAYSRKGVYNKNLEANEDYGEVEEERVDLVNIFLFVLLIIVVLLFLIK